jgi:hypothetical protein
MLEHTYTHPFLMKPSAWSCFPFVVTANERAEREAGFFTSSSDPANNLLYALIVGSGSETVIGVWNNVTVRIIHQPDVCWTRLFFRALFQQHNTYSMMFASFCVCDLSLSPRLVYLVCWRRNSVTFLFYSELRFVKYSFGALDSVMVKTLYYKLEGSGF